MKWWLVCDRFNNRILVWNTPPTSGSTAPDLALGQPDFVSNDLGTDKNQLNWPGNACVAANGKLAAADNAGLYPNPSTPFFRMKMAVPENAFYTIDLLDAGGRHGETCPRVVCRQGSISAKPMKLARWHADYTLSASLVPASGRC
ncbi:MAG: hypothetical protein ABMA02_08405 [Saprospiraceae bacterium]